MGKHKIQFVTLYGLPSTQKGSLQFNNDLMEQALSAIDCCNLPSVILGDFNLCPFELPCATQLRARGYRDLCQLYPTLVSGTMPCTCRDVTNPDNALIAPELVPFLSNIEVVSEPFFDTHKVVVFCLDLPAQPLYTWQLSMPHSFLNLPLDETKLPAAYDYVVASRGQPDTIETWGIAVEAAVDHAMRVTHAETHQVPFSKARGLPKFCRGRCQPRQPKVTSSGSLTRPGRQGDYTPSLEVYTHATSKKVKQVRRLDSICRGLRKTSLSPTNLAVLQSEWRAVLKCQAFKGSFPRWALSHPEIGPLPFRLPSYDMAYTIYQMAKYETSIAIQ